MSGLRVVRRHEVAFSEVARGRARGRLKVGQSDLEPAGSAAREGRVGRRIDEGAAKGVDLEARSEARLLAVAAGRVGRGAAAAQHRAACAAAVAAAGDLGQCEHAVLEPAAADLLHGPVAAALLQAVQARTHDRVELGRRAPGEVRVAEVAGDRAERERVVTAVRGVVGDLLEVADDDVGAALERANLGLQRGECESDQRAGHQGQAQSETSGSVHGEVLRSAHTTLPVWFCPRGAARQPHCVSTAALIIITNAHRSSAMRCSWSRSERVDQRSYPRT